MLLNLGAERVMYADHNPSRAAKVGGVSREGCGRRKTTKIGMVACEGVS